ncbi:polyamine oxidase Fms1p [Trichomonascus vanleenenianus]|uniref:flavin monoamine oxidase family protein n=1 Tax=Trichomonascus vanleenenianus TaxID=2268995 RepID=UPI003ECA1CF3
MRVIVIGAGIAGIKAAVDLSNAGVEVVMIEARDRIGGRIDTMEDEGGNKIDLGASWLHGSLGNELFFKALEIDLEVYYDDSDYVFYTLEEGELGPMDKTYRLLEDLMAQAALDEAHHRDISKISLEQFTLEFIERHPVVRRDEKLQKRALQVARYLELYHGIPWSQIPASEAIEHEGRDAYVKGGYKTLVQKVYSEIDQMQLKLKMQEEVYEVDYTDTRVVVKTRKVNGTTEDESSVYEGDYVVVTIPLGVLRKEMPQFQPQLPQDIQHVINTSVYAELGKVVMRFKHVFWTRTADRLVILPDGKKPTTPSGPLLFINGYTIYDGQPLLIMLMAPPVTAHLETARQETVEKFLMPYLETLRTDDTVPIIFEHVMVTRWTRDRYAMGSYSALCAGQAAEAYIGPFVSGCGRVRFAGEHTTLAYNGCVHGAYASGRREAQFILASQTN